MDRLVLRSFVLVVSILGLSGWAPAQPRQAPHPPDLPGTTWEAESLLRTARATAGQVLSQDMTAFGSSWSGGAQLLWAPPGPGATLTLEIQVPRAGEHRLALSFTRAPDYGIFRVSLGRQEFGDLDGFNPAGVIHGGLASLGTVQLVQGSNQITLRVTGKHRASRGYLVGVDRLELQPAGSRGLPRVEDPPPQRQPWQPFMPTRTEASSTPLAGSVRALDAVLEHRPAGASLREFLQMEALEGISPDLSGRLTPQARSLVLETLQRADQLATDPARRELTQSRAFRGLQAALQRQVLPADLHLPPWFFQLPAGALLYRKGGEFHLTTDVEVTPGGATQLTFIYDLSKVPLAQGALWQVSRLGFPAFDGGSATDLSPPGLVGSGGQAGVHGAFTVDLGSYQSTLPPGGLPFRVRVLPITGLGPPAPTLVGQPSNEIGVYWGNLPEQAPFQQIIPGGLPSSQPPVTTSSPYDVRITLDYLTCKDANEYSPGDISLDATKGVGDEPYLLATGLSVSSGKAWSMSPVPLFTGVLDNGGAHGPCGVVFGEKGAFQSVTADDVFGFHVVLMEWDESDAAERYKDLSTFTGLVGVGVAVIASQGTVLEDWEAIVSAYDSGASVGSLLPKMLATWDPDDYLGENRLLLNHDYLTAEIPGWYERQMFAAKGSGQVLNQKGEPVSFVVKPWLAPAHQETIQLPGYLHFGGGGASYWLEYTVHIKNPGYVGPYKP